MPVEGLPSTVELLINQLIHDGQMSSFKIAGNHNSTTVILRFHDNMATHDESSPDRTVSPGQWRRKPPSQLKRDQLRLNRYHDLKSSSSPIPVSTSGHISTPADALDPEACDSGYDLSLTLSPCTKHIDTTTTTTKESHYSASENTRDETVFHIEPARERKNHSPVHENGDKQCEDMKRWSGVENKTSERKEDRRKNTETLKAECTSEDNNNDKQTKQPDQSTIEHFEDTEYDEKDLAVLGDQQRRDEYANYIKKLPPEVKRKIKDTTRNQRLEKIVYDYRIFTTIAQTEDIILEYNNELQELQDWYMIEQEKTDSYLARNTWRLERWPDKSKDDTTRETVYRCISMLQKFALSLD